MRTNNFTNPSVTDPGASSSFRTTGASQQTNKVPLQNVLSRVVFELAVQVGDVGGADAGWYRDADDHVDQFEFVELQLVLDVDVTSTVAVFVWPTINCKKRSGF